MNIVTATRERTFFALQLIKSYMKSTMCDGLSSNIAVLSVESRRAELLNQDQFDAGHGNHKLLLH